MENFHPTAIVNSIDEEIKGHILFFEYQLTGQGGWLSKVDVEKGLYVLHIHSNLCYDIKLCEKPL